MMNLLRRTSVVVAHHRSHQPCVRFNFNKSGDRRRPNANSASELLFNALKDPMQEEVSIAKFNQIIENSGIRLSDPRLFEYRNNIAKLQAVSMRDVAQYQNLVTLDLKNFTNVTHENVVILNRILQHDFCVPNFTKFCDELRIIFDQCQSNNEGKVADYIPQLAKFSADNWGVAVCTVDGQRCKMGNADQLFCIQSVSKPLNYALAITELGRESVHNFVGFEPSGFSFNHITLNRHRKPHNPLINAGAIVICSLLGSGKSLADRFDFVMEQYRKMAGHDTVGYSNTTFLSERETADRNFALAYYLREHNCFPAFRNAGSSSTSGLSSSTLDSTSNNTLVPAQRDVGTVPSSSPQRISNNALNDCLDFYFQVCSVEMTCDSLSLIAATLANDGICPTTGERALSQEAVRDTLSLMYSCGLYEYSGQFAFKCGIPAKSGVSGVIMLVVPNLLGIALWSPPLDKHGNSVRGIQFCHELVKKFNFHHYDSLLYSGEKVDPRKFQTQDPSHHDIVQTLFATCDDDIYSLRRAFLSNHDLNVADYDGRTALHVAAAEGNLRSVQFLVETAGVKPSPKDRWGFTPLEEAVKFNRTDVVAYLQQRLDGEPTSAGSNNNNNNPSTDNIST